jgi:flagellar biosynthesis/type III secretory pathway protein FliH
MRFFHNPAVPIAHKQKLWSLLMSGQYALELDPDENPYDVVLEKGREQGLEQGLERGLEQGLERGLEQGLERGFHALLFVARKVLTAKEVEQFENQPVSEELVDELREVIAQQLTEDGQD